MDFKWSHFIKEIILWGVRWYVAYPISYRQLEAMMQERGVAVDHSTRHCQLVGYSYGVAMLRHGDAVRHEEI